jgi:hypothetical protein
LFEASSAVTVMLKAVPAVTLAGAATERWVVTGGGGLDEAPEPPPQAVSSRAVSTAGNDWKAKKRCIFPPFVPE